MDENKLITSEIIKGVAWLSITRVLSQLYLFIVTIYIANILAPSDYAVMGVSMLTVGLINLITEFGLGEIIVQRKEITNNDITALFWFVMIIGIITSLLVIILSRPVEFFFEKAGISSVINALSIIPFLKSISIVPYKLMERNLNFIKKAKIDLCSRVFAISVGAISAFFGGGIWSLVLIQVTESLVLTILSYLFEPVKIHLSFKILYIRKMISFGLSIIALRFAWYFRENISNIIGGKFLNKIDFGYYSFGFKLAQRIADVVANIVSIVSIPILSKDQDDREKLKAKYLIFSKYASLITFPVFIGGAFLSEEIFSILLSDKWLPAVNIFRIACIAQIFRIMNSLNENLFISIGKPNCSLIINILSIIILTGSFLAGIKTELDGLLFVWITVFPAIFFGWTIFTFKYHKIEYLLYFKSLRTSLLASISMTITILLFNYINIDIFNDTNIFKISNLLISLIMSCFVYIITAYLIDNDIFVFFLNKSNKSMAHKKG